MCVCPLTCMCVCLYVSMRLYSSFKERHRCIVHHLVQSVANVTIVKILIALYTILPLRLMVLLESLDSYICALVMYIRALDTYIHALDTHIHALDTYIHDLDTYIHALDTHIYALDTYIHAFDTYIHPLDSCHVIEHELNCVYYFFLGVVSNEEVYDQMRWQQMMREEQREKKKLGGRVNGDGAPKRSSANQDGRSEGTSTYRSDQYRWVVAHFKLYSFTQ